MFIPFGGLGLGFGIGEDGISPEIGIGIGAAFLPNCNRQDSCMSGHVTTQPNRHQRQGKSRKGRTLYGMSQPKQQASDGFNVSKLFS